MNRRLAIAGAVIAVVYLATAALTLHLTPRRLRPLFDGFAPPAPYNWVNPPPEFADGNQKPAGSTSRVGLLADGNETTGAGTPDGQALITLPPGGIPAQPGATEAEVKLDPLDAGTLAALPDELQAHSNAYRITVSYQPTGAPLTTLAKPGTVALTAATAVTTLLYSADGQTWQTLPAQPFGRSPGLTGALSAPGYVVVAGSRQPPPNGTPSSDRGNNTLLIAGIALVVLGAAGGAALAGTRWRQARKAVARRSPTPTRSVRRTPSRRKPKRRR